MAVPIPPLAFLALRYGAVAVAGFAAARYAQRGRFSPEVEAEMDAAPAGLHMAKDSDAGGGQLAASARFVKELRLGARFRVDGTALARLKIRRVE